MKLKLTLLALLISLNCLAQTLTLTHQGFLCPAGAHPWVSGDVTNSAHHVNSALFYETNGVMTLVAEDQVTPANWTSGVGLLSVSVLSPLEKWYFSIYARYEDECWMHSTNWHMDKVTITGTLTNSTPFAQSNYFVMPGWSSQPFGNTNFGSVYLDGSFVISGSDIFGDDPATVWPSEFVGNYDMPFGVVWWIEERARIAADTGPRLPWWKNGANGGNISGQMVAHHDQTFALYTSTNLLTNWVYVSDVVADEYGWVDHVLTTNVLEQQFWRLVYTNSP